MVGCGEGINNPNFWDGNKNSYLFIEYLSCDNRITNFDEYKQAYFFDENTRTLKVDKDMKEYISGHGNFMLGGYSIIHNGNDLENNYWIHSYGELHSEVLRCSSNNIYSFREYVVNHHNCSPQGEVEMILDVRMQSKRITLKPTETFIDTVNVSSLSTIITIKNHGFIKKENVVVQ